MRKVDQERLHVPGEVAGDCFAACIASILEISIDEIPRPTAEEFEDWSAYWPRLSESLASRGFYLIFVKTGAEGCWSTDTLVSRGAYWIASGPSPRYPGTLHCVVMCGGKQVHDPHPSRLGLEAGEISDAAALVPFDPTVDPVPREGASPS
ncbi:MAG: hypothetical protein K0U98_06135 [Deltaproteobacteria bacterium]|nr:hypothetical protein [Deltaproteobacteria bacterium]